MTNQHPITPPEELVTRWLELWLDMPIQRPSAFQWIATQAARWGADQRGAATEAELQEARDEELEACCQWLHDTYVEDPEDIVPELRAARRPKPPSLKEQALALLEVEHGLNVEDLDTIRQALEALPND